MLKDRPDALGCCKAWPRCERSEIEHCIHENPWRLFPQAQDEHLAIAEIADIQWLYIVYKISSLKEGFFGSLEISDKLNSPVTGPGKACSVSPPTCRDPNGGEPKRGKKFIL
ncbi:hypothetical protein [Rhizobium sp. 11515TR]|uniref:hypothetical protein n=1 Tax=Rhizobium sp. 11515TR TaxID=2028343 RepID=UPI0011B42872|nr:hypothetical protein [Rhizobium sp. 11515TR]